MIYGYPDSWGNFDPLEDEEKEKLEGRVYLKNGTFNKYRLEMIDGFSAPTFKLVNLMDRGDIFRCGRGVFDSEFTEILF